MRCLMTGALLDAAGVGLAAENYLSALNLERDLAHQAYIRDIAKIEGDLMTTKNPLEKALSSIFLSVMYSDHTIDLAEKYFAATDAAILSTDGKLASPLFPYQQYLVALHAERVGDLEKAVTTLHNALPKVEDNELSVVYVEKLIKLNTILHDHDQLIRLYDSHKSNLERHHKYLLIDLVASSMLAMGDYDKYLEIAMDLGKKAPYNAVSITALNSLLTLSCKSQQEGSTKPFYIPVDFIKALAASSSVNAGLLEWAKAAIRGPVRTTDNRVRLLTSLEKARILLIYRQLDLVRDLLSLAKNERSSPVERKQTLDQIDKLCDDAQLEMPASTHLANSTYTTNDLRSDHHKEQLANQNTRQGKYYLAALQYSDLLRTDKSPSLRWKAFWNLLKARQYKAAAKLLNGKSMEKTIDRPWQYWLSSLSQLNGIGAEDDFNDSTSLGTIFEYLLVNKENYKINFIKARENPLAMNLDHTLPAELGERAHTYCDFSHNFRTAGSMRVDRAWTNLIYSGCYFLSTNTPIDLVVRDFPTFVGGRTGKTTHAKFFSKKIAYISSNKEPFLAGRTSYEPMSAHEFYTLSQNNQIRAIAELVQKISHAIDIDENLVMSVIMAESGFNVMALSRVGASGLMQIMPFTAMKIALELNDDHFALENMNAPLENIFYGSYYLQRLLKYYSNHLVAAIAAYNAGPYWTNRWIENCRDCREDVFVDSISFRETRDYIKRVMTIYGFLGEKQIKYSSVIPQHRLAKIYFAGAPPY